MTQKTETGGIGEDIACVFLKRKGYEILKRNFRKTWGELDIIARAADETLVFVEVKTMRQNNPAIAALSPEDNFSKAKLRKTQRAAEMFAGKHSDLINEERGFRIDLIAICLSVNNPEIQHYENVGAI